MAGLNLAGILSGSESDGDSDKDSDADEDSLALRATLYYEDASSST